MRLSRQSRRLHLQTRSSVPAHIDPLEARTLFNTYTVTNANDSGMNSLRDAIMQANGHGGFDSIVFNIPGTGMHTIPLSTPLPAITSPVSIDGYTQPGTRRNTLASGGLNTVLTIELTGAGLAPRMISGSGLVINADGCTISGLVINRFVGVAAGIEVHAKGTIIQGNFIGMDTAGTSAPSIPSYGRQPLGVSIVGGSNNLVGGWNPADRNLISGNFSRNIELTNTTANTFVGNLIGPDIHNADIHSDGKRAPRKPRRRPYSYI